MPWMKVKKDNKVCVYKQGSDEKPEGEPLHCYTGSDADEKAKKYMKALYANSKDTSEFADESIDERSSNVRQGFRDAFNNPEPQPYCYVREVFDDYVIVEEGENLYKVSYSISNDKISFAERDKWEAVKLSYVSLGERFHNIWKSIFDVFKKSEKEAHEVSQFSFSQLSDADLSDSQPKFIDGMAAGTFIAMTGDEVVFEPNELEEYVKNTRRVIESTKTEAGEIVGLPIDKNGHDHVGGAGWIIDLELDSARSVIKFLVNWTGEGTQLIKDNLRRFFSPSVDTENKYIKGGSLTNWPATRLESGELLLRPVELSETIKEIDMAGNLEKMFEDLKTSIMDAVKGSQAPAPPTIPVTQTEELSDGMSPALRELLGTQDGVDELGRKATEIAQDAIRVEKRKLHTVEFVAGVVGGTKEKPFGLRIKAADLVALLLSLPEKQARAVEKVLSQTLDAAIDFSEHGYDTEGFLRKPTLPKEYRLSVETWLASGKPLGKFFEANPEVGKAEDFNLAEFIPEAKEK